MTDTKSPIAAIEAKLRNALAASVVDFGDDSAKHAGHNSHRGAGAHMHLNLRIVSPQFAGKSTMQRHRLIYGALQEELATDVIHALAILSAKTPDET